MVRVVAIILSVTVFYQSCKLEGLLDEKDTSFVTRGYAKDRLTSDFSQMRRLQLQIISYSYLIANLLAAVELGILLNINHRGAA